MVAETVHRDGTERTRLTLAERRSIASGLRRGLGPAAIARSLDRPTSTVSREIARGSGPDGYRAGDAQRAAGRRARRSRTSPNPAPEPNGIDASGLRLGTDASGLRLGTDASGLRLGTDASGLRLGTDASGLRLGTAVAEVAAEFALAVEQTGVPRGAARVLACLHLSHTGHRTARELAGQLGMSAASVSVAVRYLDGQGLITRSRAGRRDVYAVDADVWARTWEASMRTNGQWAAVCRRGADLLGPATPQGARLDTAWRFFARLHTDLLRAGQAAGFVHCS